MRFAPARCGTGLDGIEKRGSLGEVAGIKGFGRSCDCCAPGRECEDKASAGGGGRQPGKKHFHAGQAAKSTQTLGCLLGTGSPGRKSGQNRKEEGKKTPARKPKARERGRGRCASHRLFSTKVIASRQSPCRLQGVEQSEHGRAA